MSREAIEQTINEAIGYLNISDGMLSQIIEDVTTAIIDATGGDQHIVYCDVDGDMTMQHPVSERFDHEGLWECDIFHLAVTAAVQGAFNPNTKHRVWLDRGALMWEEVAP